MHVTAHHLTDLDELDRRVRKEKNAVQRDRYRVIRLALDGWTKAEIRARTGRSKAFVDRWVYSYRDHGIDAIFAKKQPGQPTKLSRDQEPALIERIAHADEPLRGVDIQAILQKEFGASYALQGVYDRLHRLGFEPLRPRPVNPKKDPAAEQVWKQHAPLLSTPSETPAPTRRSKSGSRTNADSGKRGA